MEQEIQPLDNIRNRLIVVRGQAVLLDRDVAAIYGVKTKEINQAVRNNPDKFPAGYLLELDNEEAASLRSKILTSNGGRGGARYTPTIFTEKGLYMLATILKGTRATEATIEIIETFAAVKELQRNLVALHREADTERKQSLMSRFSEVLSDIVLPELRPDETETSIELNFFIGKLKHTVKRKRRDNGPDIVEEPEEPYGDSESDMTNPSQNVGTHGQCFQPPVSTLTKTFSDNE